MPYTVCIEIAGPLAMFARPDTGGTPTSYPVPTWSACKGIFESVLLFRSGDAWARPTRVEVCRPIGAQGGEVRFQRYTTNYGGPLRKGSQLSQGSSFQLFATVLANVCYRIHGVVEGRARATLDSKNGNNPRHEYQERFARYLEQGRCHRTPCLGWSEFTAWYWGPFRDGRDGRPAVTELDAELSLRLPSLLRTVFEQPVSPDGGGKYQPRFDYEMAVIGGTLKFEPNAEVSPAS
ncbi:MAG: CRISPR-associated protein Cas5 [Phycisphaerales bacterium]